MAKRPSALVIALLAVAVVLVVGVAVFALTTMHTRIGDNTGAATAPTTQSSPAQAAQSSTPTSSQSTQSGQQRVRLQDTPYWNYAHLISDPTLDSAAQQATAGFAITRTVLSNGTIQIDLAARRSGYRSQTYLLEPGQKLYFIETSYGDDAGGAEFALGDDAAVKVDANGYVL